VQTAIRGSRAREGVFQSVAVGIADAGRRRWLDVRGRWIARGARVRWWRKRTGGACDAFAGAAGEVAVEDQIDSATEELLELHLEASGVEERAPWVQGDQEVDVTIEHLSASDHRAENPNVVCPVALSSAQDLRTTTTESLLKGHRGGLSGTPLEFSERDAASRVEHDSLLL
jgi:hypothetical protein